MTVGLSSKVMPKEVSALNTYWLVQYLQKYHAEIDFEELLAEIETEMDCYVENLESGKLEKITLWHLVQTRYWFSHRFVDHLHASILKRIPDPSLGYKIGRTIYKTQPLIRTALGVSLLGVHRVAQKVSSEAAKYNRTKEYSVCALAKGYVEIRIVHHPGIKVGEFAMQWNAGCFASYTRLAGATDVRVTMECVDPGPLEQGGPGQSIWDFKIYYVEPPLLTRISRALMQTIAWIRKLTEEAEEIEAEYQEQILTRDKIIRQRTEHILAIQEKLIAQERQNIEQKVAKMSRELVTTEERERKAIAEDLHDSVTQLLALSVKEVRALKKHHPEINELDSIKSNLTMALKDLRGLTFQISPPVLYDFGLEAALEWLVEDVNQRHNMRLVFTNLIEGGLSLGQQQSVILYRLVRELVINIIKHAQTPDGQILLRLSRTQFIAEVADEGVGFEASCIKEGFGLSSLEDRLFHLNGKIHIMSTPAEGTVIQVRIPLGSLCSGGE